MSLEPETAVREGLAGLDLSSGQMEQFVAYLTLLLRWNSRMNLTAVRQPEEMVRRHFRECIFAAPLIPAGVEKLLDFGSGAGLPGIPVAICRPEIQVTLAESQTKKAGFLLEVARTLGLQAEVWGRRVESMPRERIFDAVLLRAVDRMEGACRQSVERVRNGGWIGVFATRTTEKMLDDIAGVRWTGAAAIPNTSQGIVKMGLRGFDAEMFHVEQ